MAQAREARQAGFAALRSHGLYGPMLRRMHVVRNDAWGVQISAVRRGGLLAVDARGGLVYDPDARAEAQDWVWSVAHVLTHLGFGHADPAHRDGRGTYAPEWRAACCVVVDRFLNALDIPGTRPVPPGLDGDEEQLAARFAATGIPRALAGTGPGGDGPDLWEDVFGGRGTKPPTTGLEWGRIFAASLDASMGHAWVAAGRGALGAPETWDVRLAAWFDERFPALGSGPRLALPSGGATSKPGALDLSRLPSGQRDVRTFGVVLDTSGSMDDRLFDRALDAIAAYATARDVHRVRVACCDAATHDAGWLPPAQIAGSVMLGRRRGAGLQEGVDLVLSDPHFPAGGPILLVTDGHCDDVRVRRDHAWLTSERLPFTPHGPVFHLV